MADVTITGPMSLPIPSLTDSGPDYAQQVNNSLTIVSYHKHDGSASGGSVIDLSQQVCEADLSINSNNLTNVKSLRMLSQPSQLVGAQDVNCLYVNQNDLGFNNSNGIFIPITDGNTLAITTLSLTNFSSREISASATILPTDTYNLINVDTTTNTITINLPICAAITPTAKNRLYIIRDIAINASVHNITLHAATGNTFGDSGSANFVISNNRGYVGIYTDGISKWFTWTQNMYNNEVVKLSTSIFEQVAGLEFKTNVTSTFTACTVGMDSSSEVLNACSVVFQGSSALIMTDSSTLEVQNGTILCQSGSLISLQSGSDIQQSGGATSTLNGDNTLTGSIHVNGGAINANSLHSITVNDGDAVQINHIYGVFPTVAAGIYDGGIPAGILTLAQPDGALSSGLGLGGGDNDYPCFTDATGVSAPRSISRWMPLVPLQMFSGWNVGYGTDWEGSNTSIMQIGFMNVVHQGATLDSVTVLMQVLGSRSSLVGITFPSIQIWRQSTEDGQLYNSNRQYLGSTNPQFFPTPVNIPTYQNGALTQRFTYNCDQNNVIDTFNYVYFIGIIDEQGANAKPGNQYLLMQLNYSNIVDMRFST